jgi:glycosyltransferase involved in cell wall biosynthesis
MFGFWKKRIFWIPDFQEYYLPQMWSSSSDIKGRKKYHQSISKKNAVVVFSSEDAKNDFEKFYPDHNCQLRLLRFACSLPKFKDLDINALKQKFGIRGKYFVFPNQFWKHKNHKVILDAIAMLRFKDLDFQVVFTGSESDHRNREHAEALHRFVKENQIERWVKFLGFIDRGEQLKLMDNAVAIIQASLFEGWSTVVEDAKALSQYIVLSDLRVHKEQISENCTFFDPHSSLELALIVEDLVKEPPVRQRIEYSRNIKNFAEDFVQVVK